MFQKSTLALAALVAIQAMAIVWLARRQPPPPLPSPPPAAPVAAEKAVSPQWLADRRPQIETRAAAALAAWIAENPIDREQIEGAAVTYLEPIGPFLYVEMLNDNRQSPDSHAHNAYFHLLLALPDFEVLFEERGPDEIE